MVAKRWVHVALVPLVLTAAGCSLPEDGPNDPSGSSVISAPGGEAVIGGGAAPSPTPSPSPGATPTPPPGPYGKCPLPPSNPTGPLCTDEPGHLLDAVTASIDRVIKLRPSLFDLND